jgi:hypothetical protein
MFSRIVTRLPHRGFERVTKTPHKSRVKTLAGRERSNGTGMDRTYQFRCPGCEAGFTVDAGSRTALLQAGCVVCGTDLSAECFDLKATDWEEPSGSR